MNEDDKELDKESFQTNMIIAVNFVQSFNEEFIGMNTMNK